ncbi:MAG: hypothetical protein JWN77_3270 [Frankiales bacterium]|jgi:hypothetical protein|nr:hypothetical protein [Frankiales bacterium]
MSDTVRVLTRPERLVAASAAAVLLTGLLGTSYADEPAPATAARPAAVRTPAVPSPGVSAHPAPAAQKPAAVAAPTVRRPVPPAPPLAGCPVPMRPGRPGWTPKPLKPPIVSDAALPVPLPAGPKATSLDALTGKGIWVTNWKTTDVDVAGVVARAKAGGLHSIWVRTGGSKQGYYGGLVLPELVPAAHAAGLKVVAWDFPFLSDPVGDAARARKALATGIDAFAPDVETSAEGTYATPRRVALYLSLVRGHAGTRPIAATVPRPTAKRRASFPYAAFRPYADAFAPMVYWSCNEPGKLVRQSLTELGRLLPVHPVGQAYDMAEDGGRRGKPTYQETLRFLDYSRRGGAVGASMWTIEEIGDGQWKALAGYRWPGRQVRR